MGSIEEIYNAAFPPDIWHPFSHHYRRKRAMKVNLHFGYSEYRFRLQLKKRAPVCG